MQDNGIGMKKEQIDRLFRPGKHSTSLGTEREEGTGFGLLLCKELIALHDGAIDVESVLQEGTSITFTLPLCKEGEPKR